MLQVKRHQPRVAAVTGTAHRAVAPASSATAASARAPPLPTASLASAAAAVATTDSAAPAPSQRAPSTQPYRTVPAASPHQTAAKLLDAARIATAQGRPLDYTRLIVRNLAFDVDDAALRAAFASAAAARVSRKPSGRSMGFGFVEFASMVDAKRERDALNNTILCARPMQIDFAQLDDKDSALKFAAARDAGKQAAASAATGASSTTAASNASVGSKRAAVSATTSASNGNDGTLAKKPKASAAVATIEPTAKKKLSKKQAKNQVKILNKLLASYGQKKDLGAALKAFARLERRGLKPTVHTYSSMVNACVRCGECARAEQFVEQMRARGVPPNEVTYTALIKGLCNADRLRDAVALLPACPQPNIRTFHALLRGCVRDAEGATAARVFAAMRAAQVEPDVHAYEYLIKAHAYSLETGAAWAALHELTEVLSKSASSAQEDPDASLFSTLALACTLVNEPDLARRALLGAERVLAHHQSSYLNVESTGSNRSRNNFSSSSSATSSSLSSNAQSQSHVMFERLSADETRRECDRVRMLLVTRAHALPAVLRAYGRFPTAAARVHLLPSADCTGTLQWAREFAPLKNATAKSSKSVPAATPAGARKVKLEVCSGLGDWVVQHAESEPECDWVAVELRRDRVFQIWSKMVMRELTNLLVLGGDAHAIVRNSVASQTVDEVWINFPEPPGWAGSKLRLIDRAFLLQVHRALKIEACVTIVTDDRQYALECVKEFAALTSVYCSAFGDEPYLTELPSDYGRASYFDRMWTNGRKDDRFFLRYCKFTATPTDEVLSSALVGGADEAQDLDGDDHDDDDALSDGDDSDGDDEHNENEDSD